MAEQSEHVNMALFPHHEFPDRSENLLLPLNRHTSLNTFLTCLHQKSPDESEHAQPFCHHYKSPGAVAPIQTLETGLQHKVTSGITM